MTNLRTLRRAWIAVAFTLLPILASPVVAAPSLADNSDLTVQPSALFTIDQNRATVVDRIVGNWGDALAQSEAGISREQLRTILNGLRADHLLAASLAGSLTGLRNVLANSLTSPATAKGPRLKIQALGDAARDLVYTPVNPCRLFDTRPGQGGLGVMTPNVRRTYGATSPVANQGGPGGCAAGPGAAVALIQIGTLNPSWYGYMQAGPQGVASFPNALILYQPGDQYGTEVALPLNAANGQFDLQVQFAATDLYGDLLGYFKPAVNASTGAFEVSVNGALALQIRPDATSAILVAGSNANTVTAGASGAVIGGGGAPGGPTLLGDGCNLDCTNRVTDAFGTVGGGAANQAGDAAGTVIDARFATVGGGLSNTASGRFSMAGGGYGNTGSGLFATVGGGGVNIASGQYSTVPGGVGNNAGADYSFAAGRSANAIKPGCFVFSDSSSLNVTSCNIDNGFVARALGGVYFFTGGNSDATYSGAALAPGASAWTVYSDSNGKDNLRIVDAKLVLKEVASIPIATWNWKSQDASIRHMGPMAQDFYAAFGLGDTPKGISTVDADGVALAAIQGLNAKVDEQAALLQTKLENAVQEKDGQLAEQGATIREQQRQLARLSERVQRAEALAADVVALKAALADLQRTRATMAVK
jgi:hypothetical protein